MFRAWDDDVCQRAQAPDHFPRLVKTTHVRVTGCKKSMGGDPIRLFLQRSKQSCPGRFESPSEKMGHADSHERVGLLLARVEAQRSLEVLDCQIRLPSPQPKPAAPLPTPSKARVQLQSAIEQGNDNIDFFAK